MRQIRGVVWNAVEGNDLDKQRQLEHSKGRVSLTGDRSGDSMGCRGLYKEYGRPDRADRFHRRDNHWHQRRLSCRKPPPSILVTR
jgi:hypothetical protein